MVKQKVSISLDKELIKKINEITKETHFSFSAIINQLLWDITSNDIAKNFMKLSELKLFKKLAKDIKKENN